MQSLEKGNTKQSLYVNCQYNPQYKQFTPLDNITSFPCDFRFNKFLGFNSLERDFVQQPEYENLLEIIED